MVQIDVLHGSAIIKPYSRRLRKDSFHNAVRPMVIGARVIGLMPIGGAFSHDVKRLQFKWWSIPTAIALTILTYAGLNGLSTIRNANKGKIGLNSAGAVTYYTVSTINCFAIFTLTRRWPKLMALWRRTEDVFLKEPYFNEGRQLSTNIGLVLSIMLLAFVGKLVYIFCIRLW